MIHHAPVQRMEHVGVVVDDLAAATGFLRHVAFVVDDVNTLVDGLRARGTKFVGEVEEYQDTYRLCYVRGPEGIIVELIEQLR